MKTPPSEIEETCENCKFYFYLICRKHSPTLFYDNGFMTRFPTTFPADWCGDWEFQEDIKIRMENQNHA